MQFKWLKSVDLKQRKIAVPTRRPAPSSCLQKIKATLSVLACAAVISAALGQETHASGIGLCMDCLRQATRLSPLERSQLALGATVGDTSSGDNTQQLMQLSGVLPQSDGDQFNVAGLFHRYDSNQPTAQSDPFQNGSMDGFLKINFNLDGFNAASQIPVFTPWEMPQLQTGLAQFLAENERNSGFWQMALGSQAGTFPAGPDLANLAGASPQTGQNILGSSDDSVSGALRKRI